jgi:hypothetical protein
MVDDSHDPKRPNRIVSLASSLAGYCEERQLEHAQMAQDFGYSKEVFETVASNYTGLQDDQMYAATEVSLTKFDAFIRGREQQATKYRIDVSSASYAIATTANSTSSAVSGFVFEEFTKKHKIPNPPPHWPTNRTQIYANRLSKLDPELGRLLRSARQSFYGGAENAERASLLSMRQLYDQFFELLAPDAKVRKSQFFHSKDGDKPDQVHRKERLQYAASLVKDVSLSEILKAEANQVIKVYDRLNVLHSRQPLKADVVREILDASQAVIEQWVDAIAL